MADPPATPTGLARHVDELRHCHDVGQTYDEIRYAIGVVRRVIDRPAPLFYAGPCDQCDTTCTAAPTNTAARPVAEIRCRDCGSRYDTFERRAWLLRAAEDGLATGTEIAAALPGIYGQPTSVNTIRT